MFRRALMLTVIVLAAVACSAYAAVIDSNWVGGSQGQWDQASNWNPAIVPDNNATNTFAVAIVGDGGEVVVGLRQSRTINQLDCYGEVFLSPWTPDWIELTVEGPNGLTNYGALEIEELNVNGKITNNPGSYIDVVGLEIRGNLYNLAGGTMEVEWDCWLDGDVENAGSVMIGPAGEFNAGNQFNNLGEILMYGGELFVDKDILDNNNTGLIKGFGVVDVEQLLQNKGQIIASGGMLSVLNEGSITNTGKLANKALSTLNIRSPNDVNNIGTTEVNAGGGVAFDCNLVNETNAFIKLFGGTLAATTITQKADANFSGFGAITGDVMIDPGATIKLGGSTDIVGNVSVEGTLQISDGATLITGQTVCNGTIHIKGGYLIPQGGLSGDCNILWEPGTYTNPADFNLDGEVNFGDFAYFAETWLWQTAWR